MRTGRRYKGKRNEIESAHHLLGCLLYALMVSLVSFILLLLLVSLAEWMLPNAWNDSMHYIIDVIPFISIWLGTYLGSRRLGRAALWLGLIGGLICWLIGLFSAWCISIDITLTWMLISAALCIGIALIGAMIGLLRIS